MAMSSLCSLTTATYSLAGQQVISMVTWQRVQEAGSASIVYSSLVELVTSGTPEDKESWPDQLLAYFPYRKQLYVVDRVVMYSERPVIPASLRQEVLEILHAAHHGVTYMTSRASQSVFWPNITQDILYKRSSCRECTVAAPSNPPPPPEDPVQPTYPFQSVCMDFFQYESSVYMAMADGYSNWLSVVKLVKDDSSHLISCLRTYFVNWSVPEEVTSDGVSVFTSAAVKAFFHTWNVKHRVSSAYYPRANKRSEVAVKSAKRLIMANTGPKGTLDTDSFARALLIHRNTPDPTTGLSPAVILFGRSLRDHLPTQPGKFQTRPEWRQGADLREQALAKRHLRTGERLSIGA